MSDVRQFIFISNNILSNHHTHLWDSRKSAIFYLSYIAHTHTFKFFKTESIYKKFPKILFLLYLILIVLPVRLYFKSVVELAVRCNYKIIVFSYLIQYYIWIYTKLIKMTRDYEDFLKTVPGAGKTIKIKDELEW